MIALHDLGLVHPASGAALLAHGDLAVAAGQVVVLAAPPGAGSSLLAATVLGERKPSAGVVHLFERDPHRLRTGALRRLRSRIGVAPQVAPMVVGRTVLGQVGLALELAGVGRAARELACSAVLDRLGLLAERDAMPETLTSAARGRLGLARALVRRPEIVIADAPTAGQDDVGVALVAAALAQAAADGAAVLVLARDARFDVEAVRLGMRRLVWTGGTLVAHESLEVDIGSALDLILDARSAPMRRPRPPAPRPEVPTAIPAVTSDGIPNVVAFPITARSLGAT